MGGINYLFPPDQINALPTWRFVLHFIAPEPFNESARQKAVVNLAKAEWRIVTFPFGIDNLSYDKTNNSVDGSIEVPEKSRHRHDSLADYESDFWMLAGNMAECGFEEIYYEAIDWQDE
jgi:hypothetical protein